MMLDNGEKAFIEIGQRQREESEQDQAEETLSLLTFCIENECYGVPLSQVKEVNRAPKITMVPGTPDYILGVAYHSGEVFSVIDIKPLIGLDKTVLTEKSRLLISATEDEPAGLLVEIVQDIIEITKGKIEPYLSGAGGGQKGYLTGQIQMGEIILKILDLEKLLSPEKAC